MPAYLFTEVDRLTDARFVGQDASECVICSPGKYCASAASVAPTGSCQVPYTCMMAKFNCEHTDSLLDILLAHLRIMHQRYVAYVALCQVTYTCIRSWNWVPERFRASRWQGVHAIEHH